MIYRYVRAMPMTFVLCMALLVAGCMQGPDAHPPSTSPAQGRASATSSGSPTGLSDAEIAHFDGLTSLSTMFASAADRARYVMHPPLTENGRRSYVFELQPQPAMTPGRHFQVVTVTWARAGAFDAAVGKPRLRSTGGPGGSIVDAAVRTQDQAYDVNISLAALLPGTVDASDIDLEKAVLALARRHETAPFKR